MFEEAACLGLTDVFFDPDREEEAKAVCQICSCIQDCEPESPDDPGVWGGTSRQDRMQVSFPTTINAGEKEIEIEWLQAL